jgi:hypothetical protein
VDIHLQPIAEVIRAQAQASGRLTAAVADVLLRCLPMIEALRADQCQITAAARTAGRLLLTIAVALAGPLPRTVVDRTAVPRLRTAAAAAELHHPAVGEADLRAVDSAEAEVTLRRPAIAQAVEAGLLLTAAVVTRTAVTDLILSC